MAKFTKSAAVVLCAAVLIANGQDFAENSIKVSSFFAYFNQLFESLFDLTGSTPAKII